MMQPAFQYNDVPECSTCGGAGYVRYLRPVGHPLFGKMRPCPTCWAGDQTAVELGRK